MEKVLIVSKTRMGHGLCMSGLTISNKSIRLIPPGRLNQPFETKFDIGQIWNIEYKEKGNIDPPHFEDVEVISQEYLGYVRNMRETLLKRIRPWQGGPEALYDKMLTLRYEKGYVPRSGPIPKQSTGYWLPDRELVLSQEDGKNFYRVAYHYRSGGTIIPRTLSIRFVGIADPVKHIEPDTLVRVSLARWFRPQGADEERCYLQISGFYI